MLLVTDRVKHRQRGREAAGERGDKVAVRSGCSTDSKIERIGMHQE